jgi:hypothetical protein
MSEQLASGLTATGFSKLWQLVGPLVADAPPDADAHLAQIETVPRWVGFLTVFVTSSALWTLIFALLRMVSR